MKLPHDKWFKLIKLTAPKGWYNSMFSIPCILLCITNILQGLISNLLDALYQLRNWISVRWKPTRYMANLYTCICVSWLLTIVSII